MANVANDPPRDAELPARRRRAGLRGSTDVSGIPLRLIAGLAASEHGVRAGGARSQPRCRGRSGHTAARRQALRGPAPRTGPPPARDRRRRRPRGRASAAGTGSAARATGPDGPPGGTGTRRSGGRVAVGGRPCGKGLLARRPPSTTSPRRAAAERLPRFTTEVLGAILEHQTSVLRRLEDADRALVQIVLAGGSLDDLCEQVVGFLDGAVLVTTTDGRVIARAGSARELTHAESLDCFDRPVGSSPRGSRSGFGPRAPPRGRPGRRTHRRRAPRPRGARRASAATAR